MVDRHTDPPAPDRPSRGSDSGKSQKWLKPEQYELKVRWETARQVLEVTPTGVVKHGFVSDHHIDCTTGGITWSILGEGALFDYRNFSERAFKTYRPKDACILGGFEPDF